MAVDGRCRAADRTKLSARSDSGIRALVAAAAAAPGHRRSSPPGAFVEAAKRWEETTVGDSRRGAACCAPTFVELASVFRFQRSYEIGDRRRGQRHQANAAPRSQLHGHARDGLVV